MGTRRSAAVGAASLICTALLAACATAPVQDAPAPASSGSVTSAVPSGVSPSAPQVRVGPDCPDSRDRAVRRTLGGTPVTALVRGDGRRVAILSHQSRGTVCDLAGLGHALADAGFRVVAWDADVWTNQETLARLVAEERRRGARYVALVGASAGGATSIGAAAAITPAVDAVVALSPSGQSETFGDVVPAAGRYRGPLMVVTGELDSAFATLVPQLAASHRGRESIELLPGVAEHGKSLVVGADDPVTAEVVAFLTS